MYRWLAVALVAFAVPSFAQTTPLDAWQKKGQKYADAGAGPLKAKRHCACISPSNPDTHNKLGVLTGGTVVVTLGSFRAINLACIVPIFGPDGTYAGTIDCNNWTALK